MKDDIRYADAINFLAHRVSADGPHMGPILHYVEFRHFFGGNG